jgi:hypothetical protein
VDLLLLVAYTALCFKYKAAIVPLLAFSATVIIGSEVSTPIITHAGFAIMYLLLTPLASTRVLWGMLASAVVNFIAACYYFSNVYLEYDTVYFMVLMIMINLYILLTIFTGVKDGKPYALGDTASVSYMDLQHIQTHQTQNKRG